MEKYLSLANEAIKQLRSNLGGQDPLERSQDPGPYPIPAEGLTVILRDDTKPLDPKLIKGHRPKQPSPAVATAIQELLYGCVQDYSTWYVAGTFPYLAKGYPELYYQIQQAERQVTDATNSARAGLGSIEAVRAAMETWKTLCQKGCDLLRSSQGLVREVSCPVCRGIAREVAGLAAFGCTACGLAFKEAHILGLLAKYQAEKPRL